jgi:membrane-bound inhibitor of C-type lysozyme
MMSNRMVLGVLVLLVGPATPAFAIKASYTCSAGTRLTADFSRPGVSPGGVVLAISGGSGKITLPQVISADGGRYANDTMEFWIKGRSATLTRGGKSETCQSK